MILSMFYPFILNTLLLCIIFMFSPPKIHPIQLNISLIILTLIICLKMNILIKNLFSFMLFLTMIGGLMIIFMYITSICNNELFKFNFLNLLKIFIKFFFISFMILIIKIFYNLSIFHNFNINLNFKNSLNDEMISNIFFLKINMWSTFFIIMYLLFSLICIMNICYKYKIPLRQLIHYE